MSPYWVRQLFLYRVLLKDKIVSPAQIKKLMIYNPRRDEGFLLDLTTIDPDILKFVKSQAERESQRRFCKFFVGVSHSCFNRRAHQLLPLIYLIRHILNQEVDLSGRILIIDSLPVPVCQPVRDIANIGYKATKKVYYYGFKVHAIVSDVGYLLDYAVTKASVHDAKETTELMANAHPDNHYLLGDLGKDLAFKLKQMGYKLWTPYRKNM